MRFTVLLAALGLALGACAARTAEGPGTTVDLPPVAEGELRAPEDFAKIPGKEARSRALFLEASRVLLHPRCTNCHPDGDAPLQGMRQDPHDPPVERGAGNRGVAGMTCTSCHQERNQELTRVPGAPKWALAPLKMAWVGKSPAYVCAQLKDPERNGGKTLAEVVEHSAHDELVAWGWAPGADREPAPGTQAQFGALVAAWVETGAECPPEEAR